MNLAFAMMASAAMEEHVISGSCVLELSLPVTAHFILVELFVRKVSLKCIYLFIVFFFRCDFDLCNTNKQ